MVRLTRHEQRFFSTVECDSLKTPELMEEAMLLLGTSENSLPSLVWWKTEVGKLFESNEGRTLASVLLYYSRRGAYNATTSKVYFLRAQGQTRFLRETSSEEDTEGLTIPWFFPDEEPKTGAK